jgi:hypothetical protein
MIVRGMRMDQRCSNVISRLERRFETRSRVERYSVERKFTRSWRWEMRDFVSAVGVELD